jgi:beta-lactamase superfamily II metal-dependent hydrolase
MRIDIFDVGHGHCSVMTAPNGTRMMLDCGTRWRDGRFWTPSLHYFQQPVPVLASLNLDEDHLADFGGVLKDCGVKTVVTNLSIGPAEFRRLKKDGMRAGAEAYLAWLSALKSYGWAPSIDLGPVQVRVYCNNYGGDCVTTNDLSLAIILQYGRFKILFAGDLERKGWVGLLRNPEFCVDVADVSVFVASHHGRRNGCHPPLFSLMKPEIVIISDDDKEHETQETDAWYRTRCHGAPTAADPQRRRYVLTTRSDGAMQIDANLNGTYVAHWGVAVSDWPSSSSRSTHLGLIARNALSPLGFAAAR